MTLIDLIVVVLLNAAGRAIYYSSFQAMIPGVVHQDDLEHANGVLTSTEMGTEHLAGPIAGSTLFAVSPSIPFFADAVSMIASCLPYVRLKLKAEPPADSSNSMWEGVRLLLADQRLRVLLFLITALSLLQGMEAGVLVLLATEKWGIRESTYGVFLAAGAFGNLIGGLIAEGQAKRFGSARVADRFRRDLGLGYLLMAAAHSWVLAGPALRPRGRRRDHDLGHRDLAPPTLHPGPSDGSGRRAPGAASSGARRRWGRSPPGAWPPSGASRCLWSWRACSRSPSPRSSRGRCSGSSRTSTCARPRQIGDATRHETGIRGPGVLSGTLDTP